MNHLMRLDEEPFELIKAGKKKIEIRLNDEKRKKVKIGDTITFSKRPLLKEQIKVNVISINRYSSYKEIIDKTPLEHLGSIHYSLKEQKKHGFVVFTIQLINQS